MIQARRFWVFTNCALLSLALAIGAYAWEDLVFWTNEAGRRMLAWTGLAYLFVVVLAILVPHVATRDIDHPIKLHTARTGVLISAVLLAAFPAYAALVLIAIRLDADTTEHGDGGATRSSELGLALRARADMQQALTGFASLIAGAVLATGACRVALEAYGSGDELPVLAVLAYGAYFTAFIAAIYLPTHFVWQTASSTLRDELHPLPDDSTITVKRLEDRRAYESLLGLNATAVQSLATALRVLAPLLAAGVAILFPVEGLSE